MAQYYDKTNQSIMFLVSKQAERWVTSMLDLSPRPKSRDSSASPRLTKLFDVEV